MPSQSAVSFRRHEVRTLNIGEGEYSHLVYPIAVSFRCDEALGHYSTM
jgi:hypothetical protein